MNCVISGYGYVGKATELVALQNHISVYINDPKLPESIVDWKSAKYHFVCVPTPLNSEHTHDTSAVINALDLAAQQGFLGVTVIRSTMSPVDCDSLKLDNTAIVWPEFLRKATWTTDAVTPLMSIVGGDNVAEFMQDFATIPITHIGSAKDAAMAKLAVNSYLAVRTVIVNDIRKTCDALNLNWRGVKQVLDMDPRLGKGYWDQPGPDGRYGFGGGCLPKDTAAMSTLMTDMQIAESYAAWAVERNKTLRDDV